MEKKLLIEHNQLMSARRNISQRTAPPPSANARQQNAHPAAAGRLDDGQIDIKKMHPMAMLSIHEERLNEIEEKLSQIQSKTSQSQQQPSKRSTSGDESAMIAECVKQIKFLTQENQTNRNLARELTLELLRLKTSLQEDGKIEMHITEEAQDKYDAFKEKANTNTPTVSQNVRDELDNGSSTVSFSGNGGYDPNSL